MTRVLLAGGGSGGSSAPVLAVAQELAQRGSYSFVYVGTAAGPERELVERLEIPFHPIQTGKLRRYWSAQNFLDLFRIPIGLAQSLALVARFRPQVAFAAGGFAAVPPLLAARLLRVPLIIHQQDVEPGLANRILAPFASSITLTFDSSRAHFPGSKVLVTGNPVRPEILGARRKDGIERFGLQEHLPVVLATGGGTGAQGLNRLVAEAAPLLAPACQVIHITGKGKGVAVRDAGPAYRQIEFLVEGMGDALATADLVVSRAGLSTLAELAALGKPSILIPMPNSHQDANAELFSSAGAAVTFQESQLDGPALAQGVLGLLGDGPRLAAMAERARGLMPGESEKAIADEIERLARGIR